MNTLRCINFWDETEKNKYAPDLLIEDLDRAMHVRLHNGKTVKGFDGFRTLTWRLPPLWIFVPLLYLPGVPFIGRYIYSRIAFRRCRSSDRGCAL